MRETAGRRRVADERVRCEGGPNDGACAASGGGRGGAADGQGATGMGRRRGLREGVTVSEAPEPASPCLVWESAAKRKPADFSPKSH